LENSPLNLKNQELDLIIFYKQLLENVHQVLPSYT